MNDKPSSPSTQDFAAMAEHLPEMAWIANSDGKIVWANRRWREYVGATPEQIGATKWEAIHDPEYLRVVAARWKHSLETGEPAEMTFPLRGVTGEFRMFLTRARPVRNPEGEISCWFGINTDIGDYEAATNELKQQKYLLETLNRTAASVAAELSQESLVQMVTDVAVDLTGAKFGAFFYNVIQPDGGSYTLYTIAGVPREHFSQFPMPRATAVFEPTFKGEGVVRSSDITQDERYGKNTPRKGMPEGHLPVRSYLAAPVVSRRGEVMGGLFLGHPEAGRFTADHEALVQGLAAQAAAGIDNARLYESAQREIAERKTAEADRLIVLRELNHRVKNLFAIATGMVTMTARSATSTKEMATALSGRLRALANAHELIRPAIMSDNQEPQETHVGSLLERVLTPHLLDATQLSARGPDIPIGPGGATSLALILHELSTNAAKYGALSEARGRIDIVWRIEDGFMMLEWVEQGGPAVQGAPSRTGFGTELARMSARGQLAGDVTLSWNPGGVAIGLKASLERLAS